MPKKNQKALRAATPRIDVVPFGKRVLDDRVLQAKVLASQVVSCSDDHDMECWCGINAIANALDAAAESAPPAVQEGEDDDGL